MTDALVGAVVHVHEPRLPLVPQRIAIDCIAMILARDEATACSRHLHGLVMAAMSVFQFIDRSSTGLGKELVSHADAENGKTLVLLASPVYLEFIETYLVDSVVRPR